MRLNSVMVLPVSSLQAGDTFAHHNGIDVIGGKISAIIDFPSQLSDDQREYMIKAGLTCPDGDHEPIDGGRSRLVLGHFKRPYNHIYLKHGENVAVFESSSKE